MTTAATTQGSVKYTSDGAVIVSYKDLHLPSASSDLAPAIEKAFGSHPDCLGVLIVRDLPEQYIVYRQQLLRQAYDFVHNLDDSTREQLSDPKSRYSFGWSHGKEIMNGVPDVRKGSYYANPVLDKPEAPLEMWDMYPEYYGENIWPDSHLRGAENFETNFKRLGQLIYSVGCDLAAVCQPFVSSQLRDSSMTLSEMIGSSQIIKARLLHYFPPSPDNPLPAEHEPIDSWCGFHKDHGLLTGLCSAMYLREEMIGTPSAVRLPSPTSGLYVRTRGGDVRKISIPEDCLAFQTGEALELATDGKLMATPHCVRVGVGLDCEKVSRETFAVFMGPNCDQQISKTENFGQFSKRIFAEHYM